MRHIPFISLSVLASVAFLLLGAFAAHAGGAATAAGGHRIYLPLVAAPRTSPTPPPPVGSLPAELAGTWFSGALLNLNYYNRETNSWTSAGGLGHMVVFGADGRYTRVGHLELGGGTTCKSTVDLYHTGTARAEGGRLLLTPSYARTRTVTCGTTVSDTEGPYETTAIPWRVGEDAERHTRLWLSEPHGETQYYKDSLGSQVVGSWANGDGSAVELYDPASDTWFEPTGEDSVWFKLGADGRYSHGEVDAAYGDDPCRQVTMTYRAGTLSGSGATFTLRPQVAKRLTVSLCDLSGAVEETLAPGGEERWTWLFPNGGETLSVIRVSTGFWQLSLARIE